LCWGFGTDTSFHAHLLFPGTEKLILGYLIAGDWFAPYNTFKNMGRFEVGGDPNQSPATR